MTDSGVSWVFEALCDIAAAVVCAGIILWCPPSPAASWLSFAYLLFLVWRLAASLMTWRVLPVFLALVVAMLSLLFCFYIPTLGFAYAAASPIPGCLLGMSAAALGVAAVLHRWRAIIPRLLLLGAGIALLVSLSVLYLQPSPERTVRRYTIALKQGRWDDAWGLLTPVLQNELTQLDPYRKESLDWVPAPGIAVLDVCEAEGGKAKVRLGVSYRTPTWGRFAGSSTDLVLERVPSGEWLICDSGHMDSGRRLLKELKAEESGT